MFLHSFISIINFSNCYFGYMSDSEESFNSKITNCVFFRHFFSLAFSGGWLSSLILSGLSGPQMHLSFITASTAFSSFPVLFPHFECWFYLWLQNTGITHGGNQFSTFFFLFSPGWGTHEISWVHLSFSFWLL